MGTINKRILGGFSGKVGTVVGGSWKGIDYMRSKSNKRSFQPTEKQLAQQLKFALVMHFLQPMAALFEVSFRSFAVRMTGMNSAFAYNIQNAVTGQFPDYGIKSSAVLVSRGDLPNVLGPSVVSGAGSLLTFSWTDNSGTGSAKPTDQAILVAYCPEVLQAIYTTAGGLRSALTSDLDLSTFAGKIVETYIGFIAADGRNVATSIYTGDVTVS